MLRIKPEPTFSAEIKVTVPGQEEPGTIYLTFNYKTAQELDEHYDKFKPKEGEKGAKLSKRELAKYNAQVMFGLIEGWDLGEEYSLKNLTEFFTNYSVAPLEITAEYQRLLYTSRVKN